MAIRLSVSVRTIMVAGLVSAFLVVLIIPSADARRARNAARGALLGAGVGALVDGGRGARTGAAAGALVGALR